MEDWSSSTDTKRCRNCGKLMIKWDREFTSTAISGNPWVWRCACGHTEIGGRDRQGTSIGKDFMTEWQAAQAEQEDTG